MQTRYLTLDALAARLGLPRSFLRKEARRGVIPHLCVGGRMRFEESAVREGLRQEAARLSNAVTNEEPNDKR